MDPLNRAISRLNEKRRTFATEALEQPPGRDGFAYGQAVGTLAGLNMALIEINLAIRGDREEEARR